MCAHTHTHAHKEASICVYYIYCGMCVHCPSSSSSRCWSSPLLLRFWLPRQQNTKYKKKKVVFLLSASLFSSRCSLSLWFFGLRSRLCLSLSRLFSCLLCALLCFCFICYFVVRHINSRSLARCCRRSRALALAAAAYFASHYSLNERLRSPLPHTHTHTQKHIPLLHHSPLHFAHSLSLSTLFGRFARRRYVQFQPPKAENQ